MFKIANTSQYNHDELEKHKMVSYKKAFCLDMHFVVFIKVDAVCEAKVYAGALLFLPHVSSALQVGSRLETVDGDLCCTMQVEPSRVILVLFSHRCLEFLNVLPKHRGLQLTKHLRRGVIASDISFTSSS